MRGRPFLGLASILGLASTRPALAQVAAAAGTAEQTIAYKTINAPWAVPIVDGAIARRTGSRISWQNLECDRKVATALAEGNAQIGVMSSAGIAAAVGGGIDLQLFWVLAEPRASQALVVRAGTSIDPAQPPTLAGARIGVAIGSTAHLDLQEALEGWGIDPGTVRLRDLEPQAIVSGWQRGAVDAAFVGDPVRSRLSRDGTVMIDSGRLARQGRPGFEALVARRDVVATNTAFLTALLGAIVEADLRYRREPQAWGPGSTSARAVTDLTGARPEEVLASLAGSHFPSLDEQIALEWLGGGAEAGAARTLRQTAERMKALGRIATVAADHARIVAAEPALAVARSR